MIREAFEWLFFPGARSGPLPARRLGYAAEQVALMARHRRHGRSWSGHLENSRQAVACVVQEMSGGERCVVLGSGGLFDLPLEDVAVHFREVMLVDLAHPWRAVQASKQWSNVRLVDADVSGIAAALDGIRPSDPLPVPEPFDLAACGIGVPVDLVISLNLISQLPILPVQAGNKRRLADEETLDTFGGRIVEAHLEGLRQLAGRTLLIGDLERQIYDPALMSPGEGEGVARFSAIFDADLPPPDREWWWEIAPKGEMDRRYAVANRVGVWLDYGA